MRGLIAVLLAGCEPYALEPSCFDSEPAVELGAGGAPFEALRADTGADVIRGPQGGFHVEYTIRAFAMDSELEAIHQLEDLEDGRVLSERHVGLRLDPGDQACTLEATTQLAVLEITDPATVDGHQARLTVDTIDASGREASAEVALVLQATW